MLFCDLDGGEVDFCGSAEGWGELTYYEENAIECKSRLFRKPCFRCG